MNLVHFPEETVVIAKDQPEYLPLPAYKAKNDAWGRIVCCWHLTWKDRLMLLWRGCIWHEVLTFNNALQPQKLSIEKPEMGCVRGEGADEEVS